MFHKIIIYLKNFDWILFFSVVLLLCFGLVEIYSVALSQDDLNLFYFNKQLTAIAAGIILLFLFSFLDYYYLKSYSKIIYIAGALFLLSVLIFGDTIRGTRGWFDFGSFSIQPVEFVKILLIIFLAKYFSHIEIKINPIKHFIISGLGAAVYIALVLKQPDFGSAMILFLAWVFLVAVAGFKFKYLMVIFLILLVSISAGWLFFFQDYQKQRIATFLNPGFDPLNQGYNITQAIIAIGSGGVMGRGVGFGSQSQLKFLPEAQNDFIFAVIAEELGFLGISLVLLFFAVFYYRLLYNIKNIKDDFGIYVIIGITGLIFIEMFINIGMNIGILPVIGIPLPFLSYGGSAVVSSLILLGIAESIIIRSKLKY